MRISDWSSDVCSSDLDDDIAVAVDEHLGNEAAAVIGRRHRRAIGPRAAEDREVARLDLVDQPVARKGVAGFADRADDRGRHRLARGLHRGEIMPGIIECGPCKIVHRSEEHTSELQSLMRNSYAVFCLKKKNKV